MMEKMKKINKSQAILKFLLGRRFFLIYTGIVIFVIFGFPLFYRFITGLNSSTGLIKPGSSTLTYYECLYFSISSFTTLGFGDYTLPKEYHLFSIVQSSLGYISSVFYFGSIFNYISQYNKDNEDKLHRSYFYYKTSQVIDRLSSDIFFIYKDFEKDGTIKNEINMRHVSSLQKIRWGDYQTSIYYDPEIFWYI